MPKKRKLPDDLLMIASPEHDANMFYATRFHAPDPFVFLRLHGRKIVLMSDLEIGRARDEAEVHRVLSIMRLQKKLKSAGIPRPTMSHIIAAVCRKARVRKLTVPANFPYGMALALRRRGLRLFPKADPFFESRVVKRPDEIRAIERTQRATEEAVERAIHVIRRARVRGNRLYYDGEVVSSESIRRVINVSLMENECVASDTIVACGRDGCDPHNIGSGPLRPNQTIIMDVFPRSMRTRYFADMTRTVVKGKASEAQKRLYGAVLEGQRYAFERIKDGADGKRIHNGIVKLFEKLGYKTGPKRGKMVGFFHGTGHGVGIDIHEAPSIGVRGTKLAQGHVVTVEPGLYYPEIGGVRIEDMVLVEKDGCRNLTKAPKFLEVP